MMDNLSIKQLSRVYHLTPSQQELEERFNRMINEIVSDNLDEALQREGINSDDEICIRLVHVPLRFHFGESQQQVLNQWSQLIADQVKKAIAEGGNNVVRYISRLHGLMDFALEISQGRTGRIWAWRQLGLTSIVDDSSIDETRAALIAALCQHQELIQPVLIALAKKQYLIDFLQPLSTDQTMQLLQQVFVQASASEQWWLSSWEEVVELAVVNDAELASVQATVLRQSTIAKHILAYSKQHPINTADNPLQLSKRFWSVLIALEMEPYVFSRNDKAIASLLMTIAGVLQGIPDVEDDKIEHYFYQIKDGDSDLSNVRSKENAAQYDDHTDKGVVLSSEQLDQLLDWENTDSDDVVESLTAQADAQLVSPGEKNDLSGIDAKEVFENNPPINIQSDNPKTPEEALVSQENPLGPNVSQETTTQPIKTEDQQDVDAADKNSREDDLFVNYPDTKLYSTWGGLFYLLPLLNQTSSDTDLSIIETLSSADQLEQYPLHHILYHFLQTCWQQASGQQSAHIDSDDPVLRLLCTLAEDEEIINADFTHEQQAVIHQQAQRLWNDLQNLFVYREETPEQLWFWLCQREVELEVDDVWVNVFFTLEQMDTDIRKAGLDLDPDFVPWMGKIVKFRYVSKHQGGQAFGE